MEDFYDFFYQPDQTTFHPPVESRYGSLIFSESVPQGYDFHHSRYYYDRVAEWMNLLQGTNIPSRFRYEPGEETVILDLDGEGNYSLGNWPREFDQGSNIGSRISFAPEEGTAILDADTADGFDGFLSSFSSSTPVDDLVDSLQLVHEDRMQNNNNSGLTEATISEHLRTRNYPALGNQLVQQADICVVCQCEYENGEAIGTLECRHEYHADCIKRWLMKKNVCPLCKREGIQQKS